MTDFPLVPYKRFTGQPSVLRAIALDWSRDFNVARVAAKFGTRPATINRILARDEIQEYLGKRLLNMETQVEVVRNRLFQELSQEAFQAEHSVERTQARQMLVNKVLPEMKKVEHVHRFVMEAPAKAASTEEWAAMHRPTPPPILEAEVIEDAEQGQQPEQQQLQGSGQAPALPPATAGPGSE